MEKFGNDTFKYNGKLYKVVKKEIGHICSDTCPLRHELDGACGTICSAMYNQLKNPGFTYEDVVLVEVAPEEAAIKKDEIDYKKLYEEEHDRYEEMCKAEQMRLDQLVSWYGTIPDRDEKQFEKLEEIFPELAENNDEKDKDEKIRNEIIDYLERFIPHHEYDLVAKSRIWIDWLKKQGKNNMGISEATKQELENNLNNALKKETPESWDKFLDEQGEQQPAWSEEDEMFLNLSLGSLTGLKNRFGEESGKVGDCIHWLKSIKDRMQPQPKQEWSKEDEVMLGNALWACKEKYCSTETYNWLKSIKDRMAWKPTEEQLNALHDAAVYVDKSMFTYPKGILMKLYKQLKKLKGE